jgi:hypothetical protein
MLNALIGGRPLMRSSRIRTQVAFLVFILMPAAAGVVAVHASATCERFVRTYVTKPVKNAVTKKTAEAWAEWRVGHPNWKPKPNIHRPKYVMTRDEAVQKVEFACAVPTEPVDLNILFSTADFQGPPPFIQLYQMDQTQIDFPTEVPPEVAEAMPPVIALQTIALSTPPSIGGVPEPGSLFLVGSGFGFICLLLGIKASRAQARSDAQA